MDYPKFVRIFSAEEKDIDIKEAIAWCLNKWGWTGKEINNGNCDLFADDLMELTGGEIWETNWEYKDDILERVAKDSFHSPFVESYTRELKRILNAPNGSLYETMIGDLYRRLEQLYNKQP